MFKNWKTSLGGILGISTIVGKIVLSEGKDIQTDDIAILIGCISLLFAKDHNVTNAAPSVQVPQGPAVVE